MLEKIDNFTQAWDKISFTVIFKEAITGMKELLLEGGGIQLEEIAYFAGMFIGFVIELVVEIVGGILLTGGTVTVAAILEKLAAIPKGLARLAEGLVKGVFNTGKAAAKGLAKGFEWLISFLREGTENIIRLIREFFENLRNAKTEFLDDIPDLLAADLDWMKSKGTGQFGGRLLRAKDIRILRGILKEKGITLIVESDLKKAVTKLYKPTDGCETFKDLIYYMTRSGRVGGFNAANRQFILSKKATELVVFHEMAHVNHFHQLGEAAYRSLTELEKEMYVWEQIFAQKGRWTKAEIDDCLNYINGIRDKFNLNPIIIE